MVCSSTMGFGLDRNDRSCCCCCFGVAKRLVHHLPRANTNARVRRLKFRDKSNQSFVHIDGWAGEKWRPLRRARTPSDQKQCLLLRRGCAIKANRASPWGLRNFTFTMHLRCTMLSRRCFLLPNSCITR